MRECEKNRKEWKEGNKASVLSFAHSVVSLSLQSPSGASSPSLTHLHGENRGREILRHGGRERSRGGGKFAGVTARERRRRREGRRMCGWGASGYLGERERDEQ